MYTDEQANLQRQLNAAAPTTRRRRSMISVIIMVMIIDTLVFGGLIMGALVYPPLAEMFSPLFCAENTTLTAVTGQRTSSGTTFFFHCVNSDQQMVTDVTGQVITAIIGVGIGIFALGGLTLFVSYATSPKVVEYSGIAPVVQESLPTRSRTELAMAEAMEKIQHDALTPADMAQLSEMFAILEGRDIPFVRITARLSELKSAYEAKLITLAEYHQKREAIFKEFPEYSQNSG